MPRNYVICVDLKIQKVKYRTAIINVEFFSFHGLYAEEKLTGGKFIVDAMVELEIDDDASMKRLTEVVDYELLFSVVKGEMDKPRELIETVAKSILDHIGSRIHHVQFAEVKISKHNRGGIFKSGYASVTLSKTFE